MSIKVGSLSKGPACEDKVMIVEVIGKAHPEGQKIVIFDGADESIQTDLTDQKKTEEIKVDGRSSVLHIWPWCNQPRRNLWLEIEAEGEPIYVPILKGARETPREQGHQRNVLLPIVPMTHVYGASADWHTWRQTVLARPGYFYIFLDGKIWRELKIRTENGVTTYHDVRLDKFRGESGLFHADERAAEGKGLGEIWLPAILNWKLVRGLEVAYAEDQWPAARLNRLEQNSELEVPKDEVYVTEQMTPDGYEFYLAVPFDPPLPHPNDPLPWQEVQYHVAVRAQYKLKSRERVFYFPAPSPTDPLEYDEAIHAQVNWDKVGQDFWADEQTYKG